MLHLDFEFQLEPTRIIVVGWCGKDRLNALYLKGDNRIVFPLLVSEHARRDLRSDELRGFVATFEVDDRFEPGLFEFRAEGETSLFPMEGTNKQFETFVSKAVDESFWDFCLRIGTGEIAICGKDSVGIMRPRIQSMMGNFAETLRLAGGLDQAVAAQSAGVAMLRGWTASDRAQNDDYPLLRAGFALCENALVPVKMYWDCHLRPDLSAFGDRFSLTGQEGFGGILRVRPDDGPIETLVVSAKYRRGQVVLAREVENVSSTNLLHAAHSMDEQLTEPDLVVDLRAALRPRVQPLTLKQPATRPNANGPVTLVLEHDVQDHDIRDVLRHCRHHLGQGFDLILIRETMSRALQRAIAAYSNESGDEDMRVSCFAPEYPIGSWAMRGDIAVAASSSALVQLGPFPEIPSEQTAGLDGSVVLYDPVIGLSGSVSPDRLAALLAKRRVPMVAILNMAALAQDENGFSGFHSADAQVRLMVLSLYRAGRVRLALSGADSFFDGLAGRPEALAGDGAVSRTLASLDSEAITMAFAQGAE